MRMPTLRPSSLQDGGAGVGSGVVSGLFGVGGGIVLVPYLVIVRGWDQKKAQATSLVSVSMAAVAALITYAVADAVAWAAALPILIGGGAPRGPRPSPAGPACWPRSGGRA